MAISYEWNCKQHDYYPTHGGESKVIYNVHWRLKATDSENDDVADLSSFTAYDSLAEANLQSWVEAAMGEDEVANLKSNLDAQIAELKSPSSVSAVMGD
jgi:hypothetical protein